MGVSSQHGHVEHLSGQDVGGSGTSGDHCGPRAVDTRVGSLSSPKAEFHDTVTPRGVAYPGRLGGDQALVIDYVQNRGLHKLRFHDRRDDFYDRFSGKDHSSFRDGIDISRKMEGTEIFQEILLKNMKSSQIINILFGKMKIFYIFNHLLQPGGNGETAAAGVGAVKHIEDDSLVCGVFEIPLHHGQFIEIREQGQVCCSHVGSPSCILHDFYKFIILKSYVNYSIKNLWFQYFHALNSKISRAYFNFLPENRKK